MKNECDEIGTSILKKFLPNYEFLKMGNEMIVKYGEKEIYLTADFKMLSELIDKDKYERAVDNSEWYWKQFADSIKQEMEREKNKKDKTF